LNSITVADGATIQGRLLARNGSVTLINDTITVPTCIASPGTGSGTPGFPNTGNPTENTNLWMVAPVAIVVGLIFALILRKKRLI
jgi:hypothetical protein